MSFCARLINGSFFLGTIYIPEPYSAHSLLHFHCAGIFILSFTGYSFNSEAKKNHLYPFPFFSVCAHLSRHFGSDNRVTSALTGQAAAARGRTGRRPVKTPVGRRPSIRLCVCLPAAQGSTRKR